MVHLLLGLVGGLISTVAGMGGGMFLVLALSLLGDALTAVALSAPALLTANVHRAWLYRASLDRKVAGAFVLGTVPGALAGSFLAVALPEGVVPWILLTVALLAVARSLGWIRIEATPRTLTPAGATMGGVAAVSGAGIVGPVLFAVGLRGDVFIATASASAVAMHLSRMVGYGIGGLFDAGSWSTVALIAVGLVLGNLVGRRIRTWLGDRRATKLGYVAMATLVVLAIVGVM